MRLTTRGAENNYSPLQLEQAEQAEEVGARMAIHPDDPPFSVLGLPRIVSTATDIERHFPHGRQPG